MKATAHKVQIKQVDNGTAGTVWTLPTPELDQEVATDGDVDIEAMTAEAVAHFGFADEHVYGLDTFTRFNIAAYRIDEDGMTIWTTK